MKPFKHGLVIGKFYPPHAGHHFLIRTAAVNCQFVTVIVMHSRYQTIRLEDRIEWLRDEHYEDDNVRFFPALTEAPMNLTDTPTWNSEVAVMKAVTSRLAYPGPVDAVFSSEDYGERLASYYGATHVMVDKPRERVPVSATKVRATPVDRWHQLAPATRAGLTTRICVVGAESTGTTTIARLLTDHFRKRIGFEGTQCVPEYGREYSEARMAQEGSMEAVTWRPEDFDTIGNTQNQMEQVAARSGSPILFCDTDALATRVWAGRYLSGRSGEALYSRPPHCPAKDVYLITDDFGVPFVQDGTRDGEHIRAKMTSWFIDILTYREQPWALLTGSLEDRLRLAVDISTQLLATNLGRLA